MKIKKITSLAILLLSVCSCSNEKDYFSDTYEINTTISFDQLLDIAVEPKDGEDGNYTLKYSPLGSHYDSYERIDCLDSELYVCREIETDTFSLRRINKTEPIATNLIDFIIGTFAEQNSVYTTGNITTIYNRFLPVVIYTYTDSASDYQLVVADCYGNTIKSESVSDNKRISFSEREYINGIYYFFIDIELDTLFFKYRVDDNEHINVSIITEEEYDDAAYSTSSTNQDSEKLNPMYDREGEIFAYTSQIGDVYNVYDKDKKFLNAVNLNSFGLRNYRVEIALEKKVCFFRADTYTENEMTKSSKTTYKCSCLQIDLSNGEISYDDDFKYFLVGGSAIIIDNKYQYTCFTYYEINSKRELGNVLLASIAKENLSFNNSFVYDGFGMDAYLLDKKTVLCSFNGKSCICTKDKRKYFTDISGVEFIPNNKVLFRDKDDKHCVCDRSNFLSYVDSDFTNNSLVTKYDYISNHRFYGDYIKLTYDTSKERYYCNNLPVDSKYVNFINYGLLITDFGINYFKGAIYTATNDATILNVSYVFSLNDTILFKLDLSNGETQYFFIESVKA